LPISRSSRGGAMAKMIRCSSGGFAPGLLSPPPVGADFRAVYAEVSAARATALHPPAFATFSFVSSSRYWKITQPKPEKRKITSAKTEYDSVFVRRTTRRLRQKSKSFQFASCANFQ